MALHLTSAPSFDYKVQVGSVGTLLSFEDLAPFLDELNSRYVSVDAHISSFEPPAAGFSEIALGITIAGGAIYLKAFLEAWAAEDAKVIRRELSKFTKLGWRNSYGRRFVPFQLKFGPIVFYFHEQLDEAAILTRIRSASTLLQSLPEEAFDSECREPGHGLWWDQNTGEWVGYIGSWGGSNCSPVGVLSAKPGEVICHED